MPELSVILPTLNERENIPAMLECLGRVLAGIDYEVIVVDDDSSDGTASLVRRLAQENQRLRLLHRIWRRGLSSACVEGMMASSAPYLAVLDADMQHDERVLPVMFDMIKRECLDLVVGSRYAEGGGMGEFAEGRVALSRAGRRLARLATKLPIDDPMSGYFIVSRAYLDEVVHSLSGRGFKILLDLLTSSKRPMRIREVPYVFRNRQRGESKLDLLVQLEYLDLLLDKTLGRWVPVTYVLFVLVGTCGLICHLLLVSVLMRWFALAVAQTASSIIVIGLNFFLNNLLTFRGVRLKGIRIMRGLLVFYAACMIGLLANVRFAQYLTSFRVPWYAASLAGLILGSLWNYGVSRIAVWRTSRAARLRKAEFAAASLRSVS